MRKLWLVILCLLACCTAVATTRTNALPDDAKKALSSSEQATLFSLEPWQKPDPDTDQLHGYVILGQSALSAAQRRVAVEAFESAIAGWDGLVAACLDFRHALRIQYQGHVYEYLLCYECQQMAVYRDSKLLTMVGVTGSPEQLNQLMTHLQLPLSHSLQDAQQRDATEQARKRADLQRYLSAMPPSLKPFWDRNADFRSGLPFYGQEQEREALLAAFRASYPDTDAAVHTLLVWFGSGSGRWSGFPGYESLPEQLLLDYPTERVVAAAQAPDASDALLEGAARYLAGWDFSKQRPEDLAKVPAALKQRLLAHTVGTGDAKDEDRQERARRAFVR